MSFNSRLAAQRNHARKRLLFASGAGCLAVLALHVPALAQTPDPAGAAAVEEIVVTGSRLNRTTFETPTPVTAIGEAALQAKAPTTVMDLLRDIPALRPNYTLSTVTDIGSSRFDMRSLGASRTLVLLDGRRVMDSSPTGGFDMNILPAPLVRRVEIVTAGASSVYGSDAVTGVVNVFMDSNLVGGKLDFQYNIDQRGDNPTYSASGAYGTGFADDRGHFVIAASLYRNPDAIYSNFRKWGEEAWALIPNPAANATNNLPRQLIASNVRHSQMTYGGVITSAGPLRYIQFGENGAQSPFVTGTSSSTLWAIGGDGAQTQPYRSQVQAASKRQNAFARTTYDLTSSVEVFGEVLYAHSLNNLRNIENYDNGSIVIRRDNPFIPANILAIMNSSNITQFNMGRINAETGVTDNTTDEEYVRAATGVSGSLNDNWNWDANIGHTYAAYTNTSEFNRNEGNWARALDVVRGANGQPVCRVNADAITTNDDAACVPANPFGINMISQQAAAYIGGTSWIQGFARSTNAAANLSGDLFSTWAGPVAFAVGAEYRNETINFKSDPVSAVNGWRQRSSAPYSGRVKVKEAYVEAGVPLMVDQPLAQALTLDLVGRIVDYSTSGTTQVWKVGVNWTVNDAIRFRGTLSRDFRAPKLNELFAAATTSGGGNVIDRTNNTPAVIRQVAGGNHDLQPEEAHTLTGGVVIRPTFVPNLQFSIDGFDIELDGAITSLGAQEVVDRCFAGDQEFCGAIDRDASGVITLVRTVSFNAQVLKTRGIDLEAAYAFPLDTLVSDWNGQVSLTAVASYVDTLITINNGVAVDAAGQLVGTRATPHWRGAYTARYENGPFSARLLATYIGKGKWDNAWTTRDISQNDFPSALYFDVSAEYSFTDKLELYAKVENLLDKDMPIMPGATVIRAGAHDNATFYDRFGRAFGIGVRYRW